jgi:DNA polymerase-4
MAVRKLWGVGPTTADLLEKLGIRTIGDLAHMPVETLQHALGARQGQALRDLAWGIDDRAVVVDEPEKSVGSETTFNQDISDFDEIRAHLLRQSNSVARRLRRAGMSARTISIKVRFEDFSTVTRARTLMDSTDVSHRIYEVAQDLFDALHLQRVRIRLVGVRATGLVDGVRSAGLFEDVDDHWSAVERVTDQVAVKFGSNAVTPARLVRPESPDESGSSQTAPD